MNCLYRKYGPQSNKCGCFHIVASYCVGYGLLLQRQRLMIYTPDSKVHGAYMVPTWGRQDPGGSHVGPMILAIWDCWPRVRKILCFGYFCVAGISVCGQWNVKYFCMMVQGNFLVWSKCIEFGIVIDTYIVIPGYWQNHVNSITILVINVSLLFCEGQTATKTAISPLSSSHGPPIILCWFHCVHNETCNICCRQNQCRECSIYKTVHLQTLTMKYECFICLSTYTTTYDFVWLRYLNIFFYVTF